MAPSPSSGLRRPVPLLAVEAAVHQTNHGARAFRVLGPMVPVHLAQAFVAAGASDAVFDHDALPCEGPVVGFVLLRLLLPAAPCLRLPRSALPSIAAASSGIPSRVPNTSSAHAPMAASNATRSSPRGGRAPATRGRALPRSAPSAA